MNLLLDSNISYRLKKKLLDLNLHIEHVDNLENVINHDLAIYQFAKQNNYTIVTFDEDFENILNKYGFPPKIILFRTGNISTLFLENLIRSRIEKIFLFPD